MLANVIDTGYVTDHIACWLENWTPAELAERWEDVIGQLIVSYHVRR